MLKASVVIVAACMAGLSVYLATQPGMIRSFDSERYIGMSRSLRAGDGWTFEGNPQPYWPPLYPVVLAGFADPVAGARWTNVIAISATAILVGRWMIDAGWSLVWISTAYLMWLMIPDIYHIYDFVWSEPLFILFMTAFLVALQRDSLIGLMVIGALVVAQRFAGVAVVAGGCLELASRGHVRRAILAGTPAALVMGGWGLRNVIAVGTWQGQRGTADMTLLDTIQATGRVLVTWWPMLLPLIAAICWRMLYARLVDDHGPVGAAVVDQCGHDADRRAQFSVTRATGDPGGADTCHCRSS